MPRRVARPPAPRKKWPAPPPARARKRDEAAAAPTRKAGSPPGGSARRDGRRRQGRPAGGNKASSSTRLFSPSRPVGGKSCFFIGAWRKGGRGGGDRNGRGGDPARGRRSPVRVFARFAASRKQTQRKEGDERRTRLTIFCSSIRKARTMRSRTTACDRCPPYTRDTDLCRRDRRLLLSSDGRRAGSCLFCFGLCVGLVVLVLGGGGFGCVVDRAALMLVTCRLSFSGGTGPLAADDAAARRRRRSRRRARCRRQETYALEDNAADAAAGVLDLLLLVLHDVATTCVVVVVVVIARRLRAKRGCGEQEAASSLSRLLKGRDGGAARTGTVGTLRRRRRARRPAAPIRGHSRGWSDHQRRPPERKRGGGLLPLSASFALSATSTTTTTTTRC